MYPVRFLVPVIALMLVFMSQPVSGFDHNHRLFETVLKASVVPIGPKSLVRYGVIKENPQALNRYIEQIEAVSLSQYQQWSKDEKLAFLINAYNALTIELILTKFPDLSSIKDLGGFFSGPWKIKFFSLFGENRHLDHIEHSILRKQFTEPRIHFALVCASIGCPALRNEAYVSEKLDTQLNEAMRSFLRDGDRNRVHLKQQTLEISSIFKWFKEDFTQTEGSIEAFIAPWITDDSAIRQQIRDRQFKIKYLDYDWSLNTTD